MSNGFIIPVGIRPDPAGIRDFEREVIASFQRIAAEAQRRSTAGESLSGTSGEFQATQTQLASTLGASTGLTAEVRRQLQQLILTQMTEAETAIREAYARAPGVSPAAFTPLSRGVVVGTTDAARQAQLAQDKAAIEQQRLAAARTAAAANAAARDESEVPPPTPAQLAADTLARRRQAAQVQALTLAGTTQDDVEVAARNQVNEARIKVATQLKVEEARLSSDNEALGALAAARKRNATNEGISQLGFTTPADLAARGQLAAGEARNATQVNLAQLNETTRADVEASAQLVLQKRRLAGAIQQQVTAGTTGQDVSNAAQNELAQARLEVARQLQVEVGRLASDNRALGELAAARDRNATQQALARNQATTPTDLQANARLSAENQIRAAQATLDQIAASAALTKGQQSYAEILGEAKAAQAEVNAATKRAAEEGIAASPTYVSDTAAANTLRETTARRVKLAELGLSEIQGETTAQTASRIAVEQTARTNLQRLEELKALRSQSSSEAAIVAERLTTEKLYNQELNARVAQEIKQRVAAGEIPAGSLFQRYQQSAAERAGGTPRLASEYATIGQSIESKFATTAGFAVSGVGTFAAIQGLREVYSSEQQVQQAFTVIQGQLNALGAGGQLSAVRADIAGIARDTGTAEADIATVFPQVEGLFHNTAEALASAKDAAEYAKVTKSSLQDTVNSLVPAAAAFGVSFAQITDNALNVQEQAGVQAKRVVELFGAIGPVANQAGLSLKEVSAIAAAALQDTNRAPSSVAEDFNRLIPQIRANAGKISAALEGSPAQGDIPKVQGDIASGQLGAAIKLLITDYGKLSQSQQQELEAALGTQRGAKDIVALFHDQSLALSLLGDNTNAAGKTQQYFTNLQKDLGQQLAQLREHLLQLGRALLESGVAGTFQDLLKVCTSLITVLGSVAGAFAAMNRATGGTATKIAEIVTAAKVLQAIAATAKVQALLGLFSGGAAAAPAVPAASGLVSAAGAPLAASATATAAPGGIGAALSGFLNPLFLIPATFAVLAVTVNNETNRLRDAADQYGLALKNADIPHLHQIAAKAPSLGDEFRARFGAGYTKQYAAQAELDARQNPDATPDLQALAAQGDVKITGKAADSIDYKLGAGIDNILQDIRVKRKFTKKQIDDLVGKAASGNAAAEKLLVELYKIVTTDPTIDPKIADALKAFQQKNASTPDPATGLTPAQTAATTAADTASAAVDDAVSKAGEGLGGALANLLTAARDKALDPAASQKLIDKYNKSVSDSLLKNLSLLDSLNKNTTAADAAAKVSSDVSLFKLPEFNDPADRATLAQKVVTDLQAELTVEADAATSTAERARILRDGLVIPPEVRQILGQQLIDNNPLVAQVLSAIDQADTVITQGIQLDAANLLAMGQAGGDAVVNAIQNELDLLNKLDTVGDQAGTLGPQIAAVTAALNAAKAKQGTLNTLTPAIPTSVTGAPIAGSAPTPQQLDKAQAELDAANAGKDPVRLAQIAKQQADADLQAAIAAGDKLAEIQARTEEAKADTQLQDAYNAIAAAQDAYAAAAVSNDPVAAAQAAVKIADDQYAAAVKAHDTVGQINAAAAQLTAGRALQKAMQDVGTSQLELIRATLAASGDVVGAAREGVQIALKAISDAQARGAGQAELNGLYANLATTQASAAQAQVSFTESQIQDNLDLKRITVGQAVSQLRALEALQTNQTVRDEIEKRVRSLLTQTSGNLQFNLPSDIILPTLYEAKRVNATPAGQTYNGAQVDNRQQNFYFSVTGSNLSDVTKAVAAAVGSSSSQYGATPRRY